MMYPQSGPRRKQPLMLPPVPGAPVPECSVPDTPPSDVPVPDDSTPDSNANRSKAPRVSFITPLIPRKDGLDDGQVEGDYDPRYRPTQYFWFFWDTACALLLHLSGRLTAASRIDRKVDMTGKNVLITGAGGDGMLGMEMAKTMIEAGATLWLACATKVEGEAAKKEILDHLSRTNQIELATIQKPPTVNLLQDVRHDSTAEALRQTFSKINPMVLDLASDESIRKFCDEDLTSPIDVLVHHANLTVHRTGDRFGSMYLTNVLGPFQLICRLEKMLSPGARVFFANSFIHYFGSIANGRSRSKGTEQDFTPLWIRTISWMWSRLWSPLDNLIWTLFRVPFETALFTLSRALPGPANGIGRLDNFRHYATLMQMQVALVTLLAERWSDKPINDLFAPDFAQPPRKAIHMQAPLVVRNKNITVHAYNTGMPKAWFLNNMHKRPMSLFHDPA